MSRAILHAPSGYELAVLELQPTAARERLEFDGKKYKLAGVQDGVAHYVAMWGDEK